MAKISVIIPVYNTEQYLNECLDSVLSQTLTDIEVICIDDGSTDKSPAILRRYAKKDKRIKIITQKNSGVVVARNKAIAKASAEYIYPLDSDDIIAPNTLQKLYDAMIAGRGDIITCRVMYFGRKNEEYHLPHPTKYNMAKTNCLVNAALFRKSDFVKSGGYDTAFNTALEDYDFWLNMVFWQNKKIYRVPEILFYYRLKPKTAARNYQHRAEHDALLQQMFAKYPETKKYIILSKILKPFRKIGRFIFRTENNTVKVFKLPVYKIKNNTIPPKVAVCFFGHLRTFKQCLPHLRKNLLSLYDCDIFIHTWDKYNHSSKTWHNNRIASAKMVDKDKLKKMLNITDEQIIVESQSIDDSKKLYYYEDNTFSLFGLKCVWYAMRTVNQLRKKYAKAHNVKYDAVIFIRPDIFVNTKIDILSNMDNDKGVYFVGNVVGAIHDIKQVKASDILFWAKPEVIDKVMKNLIPHVKNGQVLSLPPEGLFIEKIIAEGYTPLLCANYKYGSDFWILRSQKFRFKIPNDIISVHICTNQIRICIFRNIHPIFCTSINLFNKCCITFSIGNLDTRRS